MILCNMALEIEPMIDKQLLADTIGECLHEVMEVFYREELGLIVENVTEDGQLSDTFEGRQMNPGTFARSDVVHYEPRRASRRPCAD